MIVFIAVLLITAFVIERISLATALSGIEYKYAPSELLVEPDEQFEVVTTLTNTSRRFIPFIKLDESLPDHAFVQTEGAELRTDYKGKVRHLSTLYMMPRSRLTRGVTVSLPKRGLYLLPGAELRGGDFLGLNENSREYPINEEIVVYPQMSGAPEVSDVLGGFLGDASVRRFIMEDPVLTVGSREYTGREPMKTISWPHSVRMGKLMVKQFDYTLEPTASVLLDVEANDAFIGYQETIEECFSIARTVCQELETRGIKYDFLTNAHTSGALSHWSYMGEGLGRRHLLTILEGLGRASYGHIEPFSKTVEKAIALQDGYKSVIVITPEITPESRLLIDRLQAHTGGIVTAIPAKHQSNSTLEE